MSGRYEVAVVGGGILGLATAWSLVERGVRSVVVLEAEDRLAAHQTGHNSGVIHSGLYYRPGTLKAVNCVTGREAMYRFCAEEGIAHRRCGKLVVATRPRELPVLAELERRGRANGLDGLRRLERAELREREPEVSGLAGLWVPEAGVVDFSQVAGAFAGRVERAGGEVRTGSRVVAVHQDAREVVVTTVRGELRAAKLVNCAGLYADRVARLCGIDPGIAIVPFRGEYYEMVEARRTLVRNPIYPVPDPALPFLGVHLTRTVDGRVEAGPNAVLAWKREGYRRTSFSLRDLAESLSFSGFWRMAATHWKVGIAEMGRSWSKALFVRSLQRLVPALRPEDVVPGRSGVRAQAVDRSGKLLDDFHIREAGRTIHLLNAPSPAATASISIGRSLAARILGEEPR